MVPSDFEAFFAAAAGVAGALVGLLFVAISVSPNWGNTEHQALLDVRAGVAFSALSDALVVSLFALVPGLALGGPALAVGLLGLSSCVGLALVLRRTSPAPSGAQLLFIALQGAVFLFQAGVATHLLVDPGDADDVRTLAVLTVVFFIVGMARAWQLIGARDIGLLHLMVRARTTSPTPGPPPGPPGGAVSSPEPSSGPGAGGRPPPPGAGPGR